MKKRLLLTVIKVTLLCTCLSAQSIGSDNKKFETDKHFCLQNDIGNIISNSGDTVSRDFFRGKWVVVQRLTPLSSDEYITVILQPPAGNMARAYRFNSNRFSIEALKDVANMPPPTTITVLLNKSSKRETPLRNQSVLQVVTK